MGESNDETKFSHKSLSTNTQFSKIRKAFANGSPANVKFPKTQLSKMIQLGRILMPSNFTNLINPFMVVQNVIGKMQNLARKVPDNKIIMAGDLFKLF